MKKRGFLLILLVFLCGCSNKLVCTYNDKYDDVKIKNRIIFDFKNGKYKQVDTMTFSSSEDAEEYYKDIEEYQEEFNLVLNKNKIVSEIEDNVNLEASKKEIKNRYESYGYKCK